MYKCGKNNSNTHLQATHASNLLEHARIQALAHLLHGLLRVPCHLRHLAILADLEVLHLADHLLEPFKLLEQLPHMVRMASCQSAHVRVSVVLYTIYKNTPDTQHTLRWNLLALILQEMFLLSYLQGRANMSCAPPRPDKELNVMYVKAECHDTMRCRREDTCASKQPQAEETCANK
jgi:hypothetical protein